MKDSSTSRLTSSIDPVKEQIIRQFASETKKILKDNVQAEYLFGSYANNKQTPESDVDILIIVHQATPDIQRRLSGIASNYSLKYNLYISPIVQDIASWEKNQRCSTLFYQDVTRSGIPL